MEKEKAGADLQIINASIASHLVSGESVVQIWKGYHPSHGSMYTSVGSRMFRGERNVGAPDPALLVLTDKRILVLDHKGVFKRKYVLSESALLDKINEVETVGPYGTDVRIRGEWGAYSFVEFKQPIRVDGASLEENGIEDPLGAKELIMAISEKARAAVKK